MPDLELSCLLFPPFGLSEMYWPQGPLPNAAPPPPLRYTEQRGSEYSRGERGEDVEGGPLWSPVRACGRPVRGTSATPWDEGNCECHTNNHARYPVLRGGRDVRPYGTSFSGWWIARE